MRKDGLEERCDEVGGDAGPQVTPPFLLRGGAIPRDAVTFGGRAHGPDKTVHCGQVTVEPCVVDMERDSLEGGVAERQLQRVRRAHLHLRGDHQHRM